jgi:hypothetical protein
MTRAQRIIAVLYSLMVVYCCVWVPWHGFRSEIGEVQYGYIWLWSGPSHGLGGPDVTAIALRLIAATAVAGAAFLLAGKWRSP